jgi:serine/threonine-protein kinase RsbW
MPVTLSLTFDNRMDEVPRLVELIEAFGAAAHLPEELAFRLTVTLDEVVTNIVRHAFVEEGGHTIALRIDVERGMVTAVIEDDGPPFDPRALPPVDVDAPFERRRPGGMGVHLVRTMTQRLDYRRSESRNVLTLTLAPAGPPVA